MSFFTDKRKLVSAASSMDELRSIFYRTLDEVEELNETMGFRYERVDQVNESSEGSQFSRYCVVCTEDCT